MTKLTPKLTFFMIVLLLIVTSICPYNMNLYRAKLYRMHDTKYKSQVSIRSPVSKPQNSHSLSSTAVDLSDSFAVDLHSLSSTAVDLSASFAVDLSDSLPPSPDHRKTS